MKLFAFLNLIFFSTTLFAADVATDSKSKPKEEPPAIGNFILRASQEPGPLVSIGQNLLDKDQIKFNFFTSYLKGVNKGFNDVTVNAIYGVTDQFSILVNVPYAIAFDDQQQHSSGLEDSSIQAEYSLYSHSTKKYAEQATLVVNMTFPTGSPNKMPATGLGSPSFLIGATFNRTYVSWVGFVSPAIILTTTPSNGVKVGNQFIYQGGIGRNIINFGKKWSLSALVEGAGQFTERTKINGRIDPNSGGNIIFLVPSIFLASNQITVQLGFGVPITQQLFGNQNRNNYLVVSNWSWTF